MAISKLPKTFSLQLFINALIPIILPLFPTLSGAKHTSHYCEPSSCGNIRNISYPFRLRGGPRECGKFDYELVCENNNIFIHDESSHNFSLKSINYADSTIRIAESTIEENDICSFPKCSQNQLHFSIYGNEIATTPLNFLSCLNPMTNFSSYQKIDQHCIARNNASSFSRNAYFVFGNLKASDVGDNCTIDAVALISHSFGFENDSDTTLSEIHASLVYGFEILWAPIPSTTDSYCVACDVIIGYIGLIGLFIMMTIFPIRSLRMRLRPGHLIYKPRTRHLNLSMFDVTEDFLRNHCDLSPIEYPYPNIKKMTKCFREKLGQGGYGSVYKGKLRSGSDVAVKLLKPKENSQHFMNEVATIGRIHHVNVVKLVGYCAERSKLALVYDFMPNGSLEKYILKEEAKNLLSWEQKYNIAVGVARGIQYLHRGCDMQILHFDIKPHNILLDENFTPKISDFGLAKLYSTDHNTVILTAARGTIGYVAPELINRSLGGVSHKSDVYSFGMLLMELAGLNRDLEANVEDSSQYFPQWIYNHLDKWNTVEIEATENEMDGGDDDDDDDDDDAEKITRKMGIVALWCIQMSPSDRPSMSVVLEMLETDINKLLKIPPRPSIIHGIVEIENQTWTTSDSN